MTTSIQRLYVSVQHCGIKYLSISPDYIIAYSFGELISLVNLSGEV